MSAGLLQRLQAARERSVDLAPGLSVRYLRPTELETISIMRGRDAPLDVVVRHVIGWSLTEADLLGAAVGASDPAECTDELRREVFADHADWLATV